MAERTNHKMGEQRKQERACENGNWGNGIGNRIYVLSELCLDSRKGIHILSGKGRRRSFKGGTCYSPAFVDR